MAQMRLEKINFLFLSWAVGRILRGIFLVLSLVYQFESSITNQYLSTAIIIFSLAVTEMFPFYLSLDWSTISILLTNFNEDRLSLLAADKESIDIYEPSPAIHKVSS